MGKVNSTTMPFVYRTAHLPAWRVAAMAFEPNRGQHHHDDLRSFANSVVDTYGFDRHPSEGEGTKHAGLGGHISAEGVELQAKLSLKALKNSTDAGRGVGTYQSVDVVAIQSGAEVAGVKATPLADLSAAKVKAVAAKAGATTEAADATHAAQAAAKLTGWEAGALIGFAGVSGLIAAPLMTYLGQREVRESLRLGREQGWMKEKTITTMAEGVGALTVGARSLAASATMLGMALSHPTVVAVGAAAATTLAPLGVVHGAIDVGLGAHKIYKGKRAKGALELTFGAAIIATAVTAAASPALAGAALGVAGAALVGKIGYGFLSRRAESKAQKDPEPKARAAPDNDATLR